MKRRIADPAQTAGPAYPACATSSAKIFAVVAPAPGVDRPVIPMSRASGFRKSLCSVYNFYLLSNKNAHAFMGHRRNEVLHFGDPFANLGWSSRLDATRGVGLAAVCAPVAGHQSGSMGDWPMSMGLAEIEAVEVASAAVAVPDVDDRALDALVHDMDVKGYGFLPNYISGAQLQSMRDFVTDAVGRAGNQYVGFTGADSLAGSMFGDLGQTPAFVRLIKRVYERGVGRAAPDAGIYQVLRCLAGQTGEAHSLIFHYDSYVVTALIPVHIPQDGQSGDLVMLPNTRRIRASYAANLADKILLDNKLTQGVLRLMMKLGILPVKRIKMVPGNIYFFWGYRSIHANEACDPSKVRATALFHFANPHAGSSLGSTVRRLIPR